MKRALAIFTLTLALPLHADEGKEKLIAELLELLEIGRITEVALLPQAEASDERRAMLSRLRHGLTRQRLVEVYTPLLSEAFTVPELQAMIAFYRTEVGQKSARFLSTVGSPEVVEDFFLDEARMYEEQIEREKADPMAITMNLLRSIATAAEAYATDNNVYPRVATLEELRPLLEPTYVHEMPLADGWGTPLFYVSDGEHYRFVSAGADRKFDSGTRRLDLQDVKPRQMDGDAFDLIFQDGDFIQQPGSRNFWSRRRLAKSRRHYANR